LERLLIGLGLGAAFASPAFASGVVVSEPNILGLLAGAAVAGVVVARLRKRK
jgi:hypothetical protein